MTALADTGGKLIIHLHAVMYSHTQLIWWGSVRVLDAGFYSCTHKEVFVTHKHVTVVIVRNHLHPCCCKCVHIPLCVCVCVLPW